MLDYIISIGNGTAIALMITIYISFLVAYFNPLKAVGIYINLHGEATFELVLLTILIPLSCYSVARSAIE